MADRLDALSAEETKDLIRQSFEMVAAKTPKSSKRKISSARNLRGPQQSPKKRKRKT
jgi:hypothetical protein